MLPESHSYLNGYMLVSGRWPTAHGFESRSWHQGWSWGCGTNPEGMRGIQPGAKSTSLAYETQHMSTLNDMHRRIGYLKIDDLQLTINKSNSQLSIFTTTYRNKPRVAYNTQTWQQPLWNSLPLHIRSAHPIGVFKALLKSQNPSFGL